MGEQNTATAFEPAAYWKLKSQLLEILVRERDAKEIVRMCDQARATVLRDAGLDPAVMYQLVDDQLSAVAFPNPQN